MFVRIFPVELSVFYYGQPQLTQGNLLWGHGATWSFRGSNNPGDVNKVDGSRKNNKKNRLLYLIFVRYE